MEGLQQAAYDKLITDIEAGAKALHAINEHERICALRRKVDQRLLIGMFVMQIALLLGMSPVEIGKLLLKLVGG